MKLNLSQVSSIAAGAVRITEENGVYNFYRFTADQEELYKNRNQDFYKKSFATSGVALRFKTDSENLFLKMNLKTASSRSYFAVEVFVGGQPLDVIENYSDTIDISSDYGGKEYPLGEYSKNFQLEKGEKEVCIYLPWSVKAELCELGLDDGAFVEPVKLPKKLLCYGDSITQGYDALLPSKKYTTLLAEYLGAEEFNKGIGGELFLAEFAELKDDFAPDYITVAYGTNDWYCCSREGVDHHCSGFLGNLSRNYPESKIFVITPIWRADYQEEKRFGTFFEMEERIRDIAEGLKNVTVISGFDFVPQSAEFFGDLRLHPNNKGFVRYFESLCKKMQN